MQSKTRIQLICSLLESICSPIESICRDHSAEQSYKAFPEHEHVELLVTLQSLLQVELGVASSQDSLLDGLQFGCESPAIPAHILDDPEYLA